MTGPALFDSQARDLRRERAARKSGERIFAARAAEDVVDRIRDNNRRFRSALLLGVLDPSWIDALRGLVDALELVEPSEGLAALGGARHAAETYLPFPDGSFDLVVAAGTLDTLDDLPAALVEIRRVLVVDGLLLGVVAGAGSLPRLRSALLDADERRGGAAARVHPALDARTVGDLLARAGFTLTVVDVDRMRVGYGGPLSLVRDLRAHAATNILTRRTRRPFGKADLVAIRAAFGNGGERTYEEVNLLHFSAWSPGPDQPKPARRGSATASLTAALGKAGPAPE